MQTPWADLFKETLSPIAELERLSPGTVEGKRQLDAAWEKTNVLGAKTRELIAVAVAINAGAPHSLPSSDDPK
jgi:alkylhydroperoxidase/carboxymuconolactone decarboxylase family protein YurZ